MKKQLQLISRTAVIRLLKIRPTQMRTSFITYLCKSTRLETNVDNTEEILSNSRLVWKDTHCTQLQF